VTDFYKFLAATHILGLSLLLSPSQVIPVAQTVYSPAYSHERACFAVKYKDEVSAYRVNGVFVLPDEILVIQVVSPDSGTQYTFEAPSGAVTEDKGKKWLWKISPDPGLYVGKIVASPQKDTVTLNVFVMLPFARLKGEYLDSYRIGRYPKVPYEGLPSYRPPRGFIQVTRENELTHVGPHFTLKQFVGKQQPHTYPKYIVLRERLVLKLEHILERVNERGYRASTFAILSGYRTPFYNRAIGNVKYSRHVFGGAADIFIDEDPKDEMMDDLNKDGRIDYRDSAVIYDIIDEMYGKPWYEPFVGGLARYRKTRSHGPFVHVDVRGFRARWGD